MQNHLQIEIDTGGAFGTGSHPATGLCLNLLERYLESGDSVLDVGTGSGILMIAAAKRGAAKVVGIDKNKAAVKMARQNLLLNKIPSERFAVRRGHLIDEIDGHYDVVVANLLPEVLTVLLDDLPGVVKFGGIFICAGMLEGNTHRVVAKMQISGFKVLETLTKNRWAALAGRRVDRPGST